MKYTASVPGLGDGHGIVTLAPSGVILARSGMGVQHLLTTTGSAKTPLTGLYGAARFGYEFRVPAARGGR